MCSCLKKARLTVHFIFKPLPDGLLQKMAAQDGNQPGAKPGVGKLFDWWNHKSVAPLEMIRIDRRKTLGLIKHSQSHVIPLRRKDQILKQLLKGVSLSCVYTLFSFRASGPKMTSEGLQVESNDTLAHARHLSQATSLQTEILL